VKYPNLRRNLRMLRAKFDWGQFEVPTVPEATIRRLESGNEWPTQQTVTKLAKAFEVVPEDLFKPL